MDSYTEAKLLLFDSNSRSTVAWWASGATAYSHCSSSSPPPPPPPPSEIAIAKTWPIPGPPVWSWRMERAAVVRIVLRSQGAQGASRSCDPSTSMRTTSARRMHHRRSEARRMHLHPYGVLQLRSYQRYGAHIIALPTPGSAVEANTLRETSIRWTAHLLTTPAQRCWPVREALLACVAKPSTKEELSCSV